MSNLDKCFKLQNLLPLGFCFYKPLSVFFVEQKCGLAANLYRVADTGSSDFSGSRTAFLNYTVYLIFFIILKLNEIRTSRSIRSVCYIYGKKYCHDSPSIEESVLQEAVMNAVLQTAKQNVEVLKTLKLHIGMGLSAETTEDNSLDLQIRIAEIEAEFQKMLKAIAADNVEAFDEEKAKALMDEKAKLQIQLDRIADTKQKRENAKSRLDEIFVILEALANHPIRYDDQIVRQILESVIVESKDKIKVVFIGGLEVTQLL